MVRKLEAETDMLDLVCKYTGIDKSCVAFQKIVMDGEVDMPLVFKLEVVIIDPVTKLPILNKRSWKSEMSEYT
jgi:hypothetical protein